MSAPAVLLALFLPAACPEPSPAQVSARVETLEDVIEAHAADMGLWWAGFLGLHMGMTATMGTLYNHQPEDARRETAVGLVGSALGAATLFVVTPPLMETEARLGGYDRSTDAGRRRWLAAAERLLAEQATKSRFATSWFARIAAFAYSTAASLAVWLAFDRPWGAARHFVGGLLIGQGRIWLHPTGAADAYDGYRARWIEGCGEGPAPVEARAPGPRLELGGGPAGLGLTVRF